MSVSRVIGTQTVEQAHQQRRSVVEVMPNDIVTALAAETAERLGLEFVNGPIRVKRPPVTDGHTAMRRGLFRRSAKWVAPSMKKYPARRLSKLALIGVGGVGANIAQLAAMSDIAEEIALVDVTPGLAAAVALDLEHCSGVTRSDGRCLGGETFDYVAGSELIIVSAGKARIPGIVRTALAESNARIIRLIGDTIRSEAPEATVIVITNPVDEMTFEMLQATGFPRERVFGMAGTLDSSRFRHSLARAAVVSPADVNAITLGSHGEQMVPISSLATIRERPLSVFLSTEQIADCVEDTISGGAQIVSLKKLGSATIAPAHATIELINHMRGERSGVVPISVMLKGEYGIDGVVLGVPAHLGPHGMISVEELNISQSERNSLHDAAEFMKARLTS